MQSLSYIVAKSPSQPAYIVYKTKNRKESECISHSLSLIVPHSTKVITTTDFRGYVKGAVYIEIENIREFFNIVGNLHLMLKADLNNIGEIDINDESIWDIDKSLTQQEEEELELRKLQDSYRSKYLYAEFINGADFSPPTDEELRELDELMKDEGDLTDDLLDNE